jgi:hypothetical protein
MFQGSFIEVSPAGMKGPGVNPKCPFPKQDDQPGQEQQAFAGLPARGRLFLRQRSLRASLSYFQTVGDRIKTLPLSRRKQKTVKQTASPSV